MSPRGANLRARYVWVYSVRWGNPYTAPPDGQPLEIVNQVQPANGVPPAFVELCRRHPGYSLYCDVYSSREKQPLSAQLALRRRP